jgi:predicted MPP superfamily phosphohydrolase
MRLAGQARGMQCHMEDFFHKRQLIERGLLRTWSKRGRKTLRAENHQTLCTLLRLALRLTGLQSRGEQNALTPVVRGVRLAYDNLPERFCGFRILHLTDLHADGLMGFADVVSERIRDLDVDLCVMTGDYRFGVSGSCQRVYPPMERILNSINARLGIIGILGNHDVSDEIPELERMGVRMLINEALELRHNRDSLWVIGVDDPHYYGCDDLPGALRSVPSEAFKILLVHTPEIIKEAAESGVNLYLCGHTHGGQICLPLIGPIITHTDCPREYLRGVWKYKNLQGYTSTGVGTSGVPVRFFCPPEIGLIELCCARHYAGPPMNRRDGRMPSEREEVADFQNLTEVRQMAHLPGSLEHVVEGDSALRRLGTRGISCVLGDSRSIQPEGVPPLPSFQGRATEEFLRYEMSHKQAGKRYGNGI